MPLTGKIVVITGASSGFGKGAARAFALQGAHLVLAARRDYLLNDLVAECEALGVRALAVPTDVSMEEEVAQLAATAQIQTIVRLAAKPEDEISVGAAAKIATLAHQFFSGLVEPLMASQTRKAELEKAMPARETSGSIHQRMPTGTEVSGGWRKE